MLPPNSNIYIPVIAFSVVMADYNNLGHGRRHFIRTAAFWLALALTPLELFFTLNRDLWPGPLDNLRANNRARADEIRKHYHLTNPIEDGIYLQVSANKDLGKLPAIREALEKAGLESRLIVQSDGPIRHRNGSSDLFFSTYLGPLSWLDNSFFYPASASGRNAQREAAEERLDTILDKLFSIQQNGKPYIQEAFLVDIRLGRTKRFIARELNPNTKGLDLHDLAHTTIINDDKAILLYDLVNRIFSRYKTINPHTRLMPELMMALMKTESNFNPNAKSIAGAMGLCQIMPAMAKKFGIAKDPYNPVKNLLAGMTILEHEISNILNNYSPASDYDLLMLALASYNCGFSTFRSAVAKTGKYSLAYQKKRRKTARIRRHKISFDEVKRYLPRESRKYSPIVMKHYMSVRKGKYLDVTLDYIPGPQSKLL